MKLLRPVAIVLMISIALYGYSRLSSDPALSHQKTSETATIVRVSDGDTIVVTADGSASHERVRLVGIDTPEVYGEMLECGAIDASADLKNILPPGTVVRLFVDDKQGETDQYGRLLRYVELDGIDLGLRQVRDGNAEIYRGTGFDRSESYRVAAAEAREAGRGIWGRC